MCEISSCQMFSKDVDVDPNKNKDERFISMMILGTEGVADRQDGRKPGGVVNSSVDKEVTETGPMYMSDSWPRVCPVPMSSPSRVLRSKGMLHFASVGASMIPRLKTLIHCVPFYLSQVNVHFNLQMCYATKKMDIIVKS